MASYQLSKIRFSHSVILISVNLVKPAGSCLDSNNHLHLHKLLLVDAQRKASVEKGFQEKVMFELDFEGV